MGVFGWLKNALEQHEQSDCETTPEAKRFVNDYDKQVETAKRSLQEHQEKERKERSASEDDR